MLIPYPLEPPPALPPLDDAWEAPGADLDSGRRVRRTDDQVDFHEGPALERLDVLGPLELRDRRIVALEEALFVWDVATEGPLTLTAEVQFDTDDVHYERAADGTSLWLGAEVGEDQLLVACYGGSVEALEDQDGTIRLQARGTDHVRLVVVGAWSESDRERTLRALARKGIAGVVAQQVRHNEMVARLGVRVTTPDDDLNAQFELDKLELESSLHEQRDGHRLLSEEPYDRGVALLSFGLREPVRDTLRAPLDDPERRRLFAAYAAWAGPDEFVRRHWRRLLDAVREAERGVRTFQYEEDRELHQDAAFDLIAVAEALGDPEAVELFEEASRGLPGPPPDHVSGAFITALEYWQVVPRALEGAVTLAPQLPDVWQEMTLERLRIGETSLDVRVRRRPAGVAVKVRVTRGPPIVVHLRPALAYAPTGVLVGAEQLPGPTVSVTVQDEVEALWNH